MTPRRPFWTLAALLFVWAAVPAVVHVAGIAKGLRANYFRTPELSGTPYLSQVDGEISAGQMAATWLGDPPPAFGVRWFGYLAVDRQATYTIGTRSDDGSWLTIDGQMVVDNGGFHSSATRTATVTLERGLHPILLDYTQLAADYDIGLVWGASEHALSPIPAWNLSPSKTALWELQAGRAADWISTIALILAGLYAAWAAVVGRSSILRAFRRYPRTAAFLFFIALTVIETWPLAAHPARLSRNDNSDTILNEWAIAWVAHQAPHDPLHLFDGNILYPAHDTLAYSESMIVQSAVAAPVLWAGGSPVLGYNLALLAGFALSGWTMSLVMARWTGSWTAALLSGLLFAFNAHTFTRLPHLQALHPEFIPLALFALDGLLVQPRARHAVALAGWFALEALTSVYMLVFTAVALAVGALVRPEDWMSSRFRRVALWTLAAAAMAGLVLVPFLLPYWRAAHDQGFSRSLDDAIGFAASWKDYLATPARFHYTWWSHNFFEFDALFPGFLAVALSLVAIVTGVAIRNPRARMCLAFGVAGVALSFGANLPGYALLFRFVPLFQSIRTVSRFGYLGIVSMAMLAGFGFVELRRRLSPSAGLVVAAIALVLAAAEPYSAPIWFARFDGISPIYAPIANEPHAVVAELPFYSSAASFQHAAYMLNSTSNWKPIINGYSSFHPPSFVKDVEMLATFPSATAIAQLRSDGVTDFIVHGDQMGAGVLTVVDAIPGVRRVVADGLVVRYQFYDPPVR